MWQKIWRPVHRQNMTRHLLEKTTVLQVVLDDNVSDGIEHKLHVLGVGGAGEMGVDLLGVLSLVQVLKLALDVCCGLLVGVGAYEVGGDKEEMEIEGEMRSKACSVFPLPSYIYKKKKMHRCTYFSVSHQLNMTVRTFRVLLKTIKLNAL